ncbi:MAG: four helix bundle protein [Anaerolineae bacterium]|nr:four helix bundle protein [Anaerolineae bacterium]
MRRLHSTKGPDLCERTFKFGVRITKLVRRLPRDVAGYEIGRQVLRSGTSVGANVEEADAAESTDDFLHKLKIALKEAQETRFWLRTIRESELLIDKEVDALIQETNELIKILNAIITNTTKSKLAK